MTDITKLVIHVKGNEDRRQFIQQQLDTLGFPCHYILDGNVEDLTPEILDRYFADDGRQDTMHGRFPRTSCAYKHLLAMQYIIDHRLDGALVVEDDLRIYRNFKPLFHQSMEEYETRYADLPFIANYEESSLLLVPRSQRRDGILLYPAQRDRFAGCYFINSKGASAIMDYVRHYKSDTTSDRLHTKLIGLNRIAYFWSHPCLACQSSCDGSMPTMIPTRPRPLKRLKWYYKRCYKHLLYFLR
jgi:glycosyl transferase family 25